MISNRWLLPEGIDEVLPPAAWQLERLRRQLLDLYHCWGYDLVLPPFIEFLESLLTGTGNDLDLQTFKLIDQLSGRMLGVRADMTPQVARIDAHQLRHDLPNRLCYIGTVLRTRSEGFDRSRGPIQVGAELYGHGGSESDEEIVALMLATLATAGIDGVHLDLGHVGIFRSLVQQACLSNEQEAVLFELLQRKALPELQQQLAAYALPSPLTAMFLVLAELNGDEAVLIRARRCLHQGSTTVQSALDELQSLHTALKNHYPDLPVYFDLAELRGYRYHTGIVFAAYVSERGQEIARGGRYDEIGKVFGRARPATGFSTDLQTLLALRQSALPAAKGIYAPAEADEELAATIARLRAENQRVVQNLPGLGSDPARLNCDRELVKKNATWVVVPLSREFPKKS